MSTEIGEVISGDQPEEISVHFKSKQELYAAYMPFVQQSGLFIRTTRQIKMGAVVQLSIQLLDEPRQYTATGKVVWITPSGAQGGMRAGIGVQLPVGDAGLELVKHIQVLTAGLENAELPTDTM